MKKILLALLALILAFSLVACNTGNSSGKETTDTDAETTTKADVTDDRNHDSDDDDDSTGTTTNTVKPGTATKPNDTAGTEDSTNNNNKPADTTNNGGSTVTTQNSGNTNTPAEPSVFDKLYNSNKNNKLSFVDAMSLFEDLIASPVALEDGSESFRISFTAMMDYSLTEGNDTEESQLPVTVDYIHVKNGDYSLSFSIMDSLLATTSRVDGVIYTSITDLESGEASKIKVQPTEQELEEFLNEYNALISSLDFEALMNEIMGYSGPQVSNKVTPTGAYEVVTDITGGSVIITKPGAGDVEISTFDNQLDFVPDGKDPDYEIMTGMPDSDPMAELAESIIADVFADEAPADVAEKALGDAELFFDEDGNFHIAAKGGFDYLNSKLVAIAAALDEQLPKESLDALELPTGVTIADIVEIFSFKSDSYMLELVCKPDGTLCGIDIDFGIKGENDEGKLNLGLVLGLDISVDSTLALTAPTDKDDYLLTTLDALMEAMEEVLGSMTNGGDNFIDVPEINVDGLTAEDLGLVPEDGIIYLHDDPHKRAMQMAYISECEDPVAEFGSTFKAEVMIDEFFFDGESYTYYCTAPKLDVDDPYYYLCYMAFVSDAEYEVGDTITLYFAFVEVDGFIQCVDVTK